mgnify:CR=1 FL=1
MFLLIFILILVALIWVHELGHLLVAKLFGIRVSEFNIGFPPRLFSVRWGETRYAVSLILVGGYVSIFGEDGEEGKGNPRSMASKPRVVQAAVIVAGVAMNLLVGWLALSAGYMAGMQATPGTSAFGEVRDTHATVTQVLPGSPAQKVGLAAGDKIESLQTGTQRGEQIQSAEQATNYIAAHQNESLLVTVLRGTEEKVFVAKPADGIVVGKKALGVSMADVGILQLPVHLALLQGAVSAKDVTVSTAQGLGIFFGSLVRGVADWNSVAGPVGIAGAGSSAVQDGFAAAAFVTALISINLAIINLVPIPGLDGGRLLIIIIEGIIRRPVSPRVVNTLSLTGFALIILLMVVVTYHDIARLVG